MNSPAWHDSVFILAYDEGGGLDDHVPPFTVVAPDDNPPQLKPGDLPGDFTLSGFRVPMIVVSPWVKPHFVSHTNRDLTSILKLIETRFSLPPLTRRDAAADDMTSSLISQIRQPRSHPLHFQPSRPLGWQIQNWRLRRSSPVTISNNSRAANNIAALFHFKTGLDFSRTEMQGLPATR